jgi:hypothetical protein
MTSYTNVIVLMVFRATRTQKVSILKLEKNQKIIANYGKKIIKKLVENSHNKKLTGDGNFPIPIFTKNKITNNYSKFKIDLFIKSIKKYNGFETVRIDWKAATVRLKINLLCFLVQREEIFFFVIRIVCLIRFDGKKLVFFYLVNL